MRPSDSLKASLDRTLTRYQGHIDEAREYLRSRALEDAIGPFRLGVVRDPDPLHADYEGRLAIGYLTPTGVVSMRFRCLEDHDCREDGCPKYIQPSGEPTHIYNVDALHKADTVIGVCEGELDAITATQAGLHSVGIPGAHNWKPFWYRLFDDFGQVIILGDGDKAGRGFASKLAHSIPGGEAKVLPEGHDVNSYVAEHGPEALLAFIAL